VIETIVNNRTAVVSWTINTQSLEQTDVALFGTGLQGTMTTWELRDTGNNNATN
jgi:ketol-acid reductoisomerase